MNTCGINPTPGEKQARATLAEAECLLEAEWKTSWCTSGEQQCEQRKVVLRPMGDGLRHVGVSKVLVWRQRKRRNRQRQNIGA